MHKCFYLTLTTCNDLVNINSAVQVLVSLRKSLMNHTTSHRTIIWKFFSFHKDRSNEFVGRDCLLNISLCYRVTVIERSKHCFFPIRIFTSSTKLTTHNRKLIHSSKHCKQSEVCCSSSKYNWISINSKHHLYILSKGCFTRSCNSMPTEHWIVADILFRE